MTSTSSAATCPLFVVRNKKWDVIPSPTNTPSAHVPGVLIRFAIVSRDFGSGRHDEDMIAEIHARRALNWEILLKRFEEEMGDVTKDERIVRSQFRALVSRLFGPEAAKRVPAKRRPGADGMRV